MELNKVYFFTSTIHNWIPVLANQKNKEIILSSLKYLKEKDLLKIYGYVIMPNHIHLIFEALRINGKEMPHASFLKFTAHEFLKYFKSNSNGLLEQFKVKNTRKNYEFWQENAHYTELFSPDVAFQKLEYIHNNPCQKKWMLCDDPMMYQYSSFEFYENGFDRFGLLSNLSERIY